MQLTTFLPWRSLCRQSSGFVLFSLPKTLPFSSSEHSLTGRDRRRPISSKSERENGENRILFHIYFTSFHSSRKNELNKSTSLPMCGFIVQLVEQRTGIAEVTGSNPVEGLIFFSLLLSSCLNWKIYSDNHSSL